MSGVPHDTFIAVIGMAGRFPGARDIREYWRNLVDGTESVTVLSDEQLRANGVAESVIRDPGYVKARPMVADVDAFDAPLFGYTPADAQVRSPHGRLFLEVCHAALEDAGYDPFRYPGAIGLFGGGANNFYGEHAVKRNRAVLNRTGLLGIDIGNQVDYLTTEVSYRLNLRGPSVNVHTACSTSLVAVHLASQSLRAGECAMALAGGVEVNLPNGHGYEWQEGSIYSGSGHCRPFDAGADGTIFGSGSGVVVLKRLADARADGDHVYAVIRASVVNNDGADRPGFTAPGLAGQRRLVTDALAAAAVEPDSIGYVEAHGTGTLVGDPLEFAALTSAFRDAGATGDQYCAIGSVKANVGHLGAAAGAAALIKVCLAMEHGLLPPSINFDEPNPSIDFASSPFAVDTAPRPWRGEDGPRRATVSSFGIGGTNAQLVLEEPPAAPERPEPERPQWQVLALSARTATAADRAVQRLAEDLRQNPERPLADVAYTLQSGRTAHPHRRAVVALDVPEAATLLGGTRILSSRAPARGAKPVFLFPGQGAQYPDMGRDLYRHHAAYRDAVDRCADLLAPLTGLDPRTAMFPAAGEGAAAADLLRQTWITQPALFVVEYALAELLRSWGVTPAAMVGHSVGEYTAAHLAGVLELADALALVAARGELMASMPAGAMAAVPLPEAELRALLPAEVEIAAVNAPAVTVLSGPAEAVAEVAARLAEHGVKASQLHTSHAFHSRMMEPAAARFRERVAAVTLRPPRIPFVSNVTGTWITAEQATDPGYWAGHLRAPVRFADGLAAIAGTEDPVLVEVGPGDGLTGLAGQTLGRGTVPAVPTMRHARRVADDERTLLEAVARMWTHGVPVAWERTHATPGRRISLPGYPYERQRHWVEPDRQATVDGDASDESYLPLDEAFFAPVWREEPVTIASDVDTEAGWLVLSPGDGPVEQVVAALREAGAAVVVAECGAEFAVLGAGRYAVRPGEPADYRELLAALPPGTPTRVLHGWTATPATDRAVEPGHVAAVTERGFGSLLLLCQELDRRAGTTPVEVFAVSANLQDVAGGEVVEPAKALLLGPALVVNREMGRISCRSVDMSLPARLPDATLARQILTECATPARRDSGPVTQVAWRGGKRWVWSYTRIHPAGTGGTPPLLRPDGTYLITGGLGGLGLAVARDLAGSVRARLVLLGRSDFPDRARWSDLLADPGTGERLRDQLRQLAEIEAAGGEVAVYSCDVADEDALRAVVESAERRFGPIAGVVHAAGLVGKGMIAVKTREQAERVLRPKVAGTLALDRVLGDRVDFMVLFSSIAAVLGHYGMADYCAANNFLDAFARRRAAQGAPVYSVGWPAWRHIGMVRDESGAAPAIFRELESGLRYEPFDHPLLDRRVLDGSGDVVLAGTLTPTGHWAVAEHRVGGAAVLPGTASLDLLHTAFRAAGGAGGGVELGDVAFLRPVVVEAARELRVVLTPSGEGYEASIASAPAGGAPVWTEHVRARVRAVPATAATHDLTELRKACGEVSTAPEGGDDEGNLVRFGPHWGNIAMLWTGERQELGRIELPERFHAECAAFTLHPSLADDALSHHNHIRDAARAGNQHLPLSYRRVVVHAPLPPRFYAHIRHLDDGAGEIVSFDATLLADDGTELVTVREYALRRVDPSAVRASLASPASPAGAGAPAGTGVSALDGRDVDDWGIEPEFGIAALRRMLAPGNPPHVVVTPEELGRAVRRVAGLDSELLTRELAGGSLVLAEAAQRTLDTEYVAAQTPLEQTLATLWAQLLGVERIGIDDDFFELGGNSLVAIQLGAQIRRHFDIDLPLATLFEQPSVRTLAAALESTLLDKVAAMSDEEVARAMAALERS